MSCQRKKRKAPKEKERKSRLDSFSILRYLFITCIHDLLINYLILDILQVYYIINIPYILFGSFS
uniref:Uncharacterized protein n=1 Tax=Siphoviridae sp. ctBCr48 TaxID=2827802 RepID=A0A8S5SII5_9CAUD|nr:MAG TPA: hypothetical protein [Siphoviridae sp. ctBCr48]